jgi:hypothetical protein
LESNETVRKRFKYKKHKSPPTHTNTHLVPGIGEGFDKRAAQKTAASNYQNLHKNTAAAPELKGSRKKKQRFFREAFRKYYTYRFKSFITPTLI